MQSNFAQLGFLKICGFCAQESSRVASSARLQFFRSPPRDAFRQLPPFREQLIEVLALSISCRLNLRVVCSNFTPPFADPSLDPHRHRVKELLHEVDGQRAFYMAEKLAQHRAIGRDIIRSADEQPPVAPLAARLLTGALTRAVLQFPQYCQPYSSDRRMSQWGLRQDKQVSWGLSAAPPHGRAEIGGRQIRLTV